MSDIPDRPHRTGFFWLDLLVGISAVVISVVSLFVAQRADRTQERLLAASVWPYVEYDSSNVSPSNGRWVTLTVRNAGVGPARIRWMTLDYQGKAVSRPRELFEACCHSAALAALRKTLVTSTVSHTVLVPHESRDFLLVRPNTQDEIAFDALDRHRGDIHVRLCYCSVLGDCWIMDHAVSDDPASVPNCNPPNDVLFQG